MPRLKKRRITSSVEQTTRKRNQTQSVGYDEDHPLTDRAWLMLKHYLAMEIPNQYQAYRMAGYSGKGQSGIVSASQIFTAPNFQKALKAEIENRKRLVAVEANLVIRNILSLANANIKDICEWDEHDLRLKPSAQLTRDQSYPIAEVKETIHRDGTKAVQVKMIDKVRPLEMLATHLGFLDPDKSAGESVEKQAEKIKEAAQALISSIPVEPAPTDSPSPSAEAEGE